MKRITVLVSLLICLSFAIVNAQQYKEDFNGDDNINISDVIALLLFQRANPGDLQADYNENGNANISDAIALLLAIRDGDLTPVEPSPSPEETEFILGITMVSIPADSFQMGHPQKAEPVHMVTLDAFQMSTTEITQGQYQAVMGNNPSYFTGDDSHPVEQVSWNDAVAFCNKLSVLTGFEPCYDMTTWECNFWKDGFRLPTEAEWEYAARAGTSTGFYSGDSDSDLDIIAWHKNNSDNTTHPVGQKKPNAWGLYDIHGNVGEWCNDWHYYSYYSVSPSFNPRGATCGEYRVVRGGDIFFPVGGWFEYPRVYSRSSGEPNNQSYSLGFRIVRKTETPDIHGLYGSILMNGGGLVNVFINVTGSGVDTTLKSGYFGEYSTYNLRDGNYTLIPQKDGYTFSPASLSVTISGANITAENIIASVIGSYGKEVICGITMVSLPSGSFHMGQPGRIEPVHEVILDSFQMSATEVTQAQYQAMMGNNPSKFTGDDNRPVEQVTWYDAVTFCNKLSEEAGFEPCYNLNTLKCDFSKNGFRLPTEAEWEYACRAGTTTEYYTGYAGKDIGRAAWWYDNSESTTHPVGQKESNSWGLYDMYGNVMELCNDWYSDDYYSISPRVNPKGPDTGSVVVVRGGSLNTVDSYKCWSGYRQDYSTIKTGYAYFTQGFRVVRGLGGVGPAPGVEVVITTAAGGTVDYKGEVKLEIDPNTFAQDVTISISEAEPASVPLPSEMPSLGTPVSLQFTDADGRPLQVDYLSTDSIEITFGLQDYTGDPENLAAVYIDSDSVLWFLEGSFDETSKTLTASLPAKLINWQQSETTGAELQAVVGYWMLWVVVVNLENHLCKDDYLAQLSPEPSNSDKKIPVIFIHGWQPVRQSCLLYSQVDPFPDLRKHLAAKLDTTLNYEFFTFTYPTFFDPSHNASFLKDVIENELLTWGDKLVLVCHSMGGLVSRYYLEELGGLSRVQRIITCGTPHQGSPHGQGATIALPTDGTKSLNTRSNVIKTLRANESTIMGGSSRHKYITYAGDVSKSDPSAFMDKVLKAGAKIFGSAPSDAIVAVSSAIPVGTVYKYKIFAGYDHMKMQNGNGRVHWSLDPLFEEIYWDLKELLYEPSLVNYQIVLEKPTVQVGGTFTARFQIDNPNETPIKVELQLWHMSDDGAEDTFLPEDHIIAVNPGKAWYEMPCTVKTDMKEGLYDIAWYVLDPVERYTSDSTDYVQDLLTISDIIPTDVEMISIRTGSFMMGYHEFSVADTGHKVTLSAFEMSATEITQAQYQDVMGTNPSFFTGDDSRPVDSLTWHGAVEFCNRLSEQHGYQPCYNLDTWECDFTKNGYRLPTEAEWEYACRAGTSTHYNLGDTEDDLKRAGWYEGNSGGQTHPVAEKTANAWGLYDMHGNVYEWCNDWYDINYYSVSPDINPTGPTGPVSIAGITLGRVIRGGSYRGEGGILSQARCRSVERWSYLPSNKFWNIGFRVVRRD